MKGLLRIAVEATKLTLGIAIFVLIGVTKYTRDERGDQGGDRGLD